MQRKKKELQIQNKSEELHLRKERHKKRKNARESRTRYITDKKKIS
jgi:hypothetical protein